MAKATKKNQSYKVTIAVLCAIIILQWIFIANILKPKEVVAPPKPAVPPKIEVKGKIAIVLDDWGYNEADVQVVVRLRYPLTIAVLPNLPYSRYVADELHQKGFEIILHLPLQPQEKFRLEKNTILTSMSQPAVSKIIAAALESVPSAIGVSNHMGSRATSDINTMGIVLGELKKRRLYFLDSFVSASSVAQVVAQKNGVRFAKRDIFLDNKTDAAYIKNQLYKLKVKARLNGSAIGICHDRAITLEVLREMIPKLEKEGYKFVFVSDLMR